MPYKLITPASEFPVLRDELAKVQIKVSGTSEDGLIDLQIASATELVEDYTSRSLMQTAWELQLDDWLVDCHGVIQLLKNPVVSVVSIKYDDVDDVEQTLDTDEYQVDIVSLPAKIRFIGTLPSVYDKPNAIRIRFVSGYGAAADNATAQRAAIPARAKMGILRAVGDFYENRQDEITGSSISKLSNSIESFLNPLRLFL